MSGVRKEGGWMWEWIEVDREGGMEDRSVF